MVKLDNAAQVGAIEIGAFQKIKYEFWFFRNIFIKKHSTDTKLISMPTKAMYYDLKKSKFIFLFIFIRMVVKTEVCGPQIVGLV